MIAKVVPNEACATIPLLVFVGLVSEFEVSGSALLATLPVLELLFWPIASGGTFRALAGSIEIDGLFAEPGREVETKVDGFA